MIIVKGELRLKDEGRDGALDAIRTVIAATRPEDGNVTCVYGVDVDEPDLVHIYEEWESQDAINAHMGTPHMAEFMGAIGTAVAAVSITSHEVTNSTKMM